MNYQELVYKLIEQHYRSPEHMALIAYARRRVGETWAEDCVQASYERALKYYSRLPLDFVGINKYMKIILCNIVRDYVNGNVENVEIEEHHWESGDLVEQEEAKASLGSVMEYLKTFEETKRGVLYSVLVQGERPADVSKIFDVNEASIRKMCQRFREDVRERF